MGKQRKHNSAWNKTLNKIEGQKQEYKGSRDALGNGAFWADYQLEYLAHLGHISREVKVSSYDTDW